MELNNSQSCPDLGVAVPPDVVLDVVGEPEDEVGAGVAPDACVDAEL